MLLASAVRCFSLQRKPRESQDEVALVKQFMHVWVYERETRPVRLQ